MIFGVPVRDHLKKRLQITECKSTGDPASCRKVADDMIDNVAMLQS